MRTIFVMLALTALAACGGLPSNGQVMVKGGSYGIFAGTDPANGGFSASIGQKSGLIAYNPNTTGGKDGAAKQTLSASYASGAVEDSRGMMAWDKAEASAGNTGAVVGLGTGAAFGPAAVVLGCQMGNLASEVKVDCMRMFE
jgi:hypothetical protein